MPIQDRMQYLIIVRSKNGAEYLAERSISDMDRATTVLDISEGQYEYMSVLQVIEFNPAEHTSRDVTEDIAKEVVQIWADSDEPINFDQYEFAEMHAGTRVARSFICEVA